MARDVFRGRKVRVPRVGGCRAQAQSRRSGRRWAGPWSPGELPAFDGAAVAMTDQGVVLSVLDTPTLVVSGKGRRDDAIPDMASWLRPFALLGTQAGIEAHQAMPSTLRGRPQDTSSSRSTGRGGRASSSDALSGSESPPRRSRRSGGERRC